MRKKVGIIKRVTCIGLVFLLSINSFAAIVSDNDGSAFITKAEFDALKSSFQAQIDTYNQSIDSKIDGAIASYLSGIKLSSSEQITGGYLRYSDLQFFNALGIETYSYNTRAGDEMTFSGDPTTTTSALSPLNSNFMTKENNTYLPLAGARDRCRSFVFDFYGQDSTMAKVFRMNNSTYINNFYLYNKYNGIDQMAFDLVLRMSSGKESVSELSGYSINGALELLLKFGGYGYLGAQNGGWDGGNNAIGRAGMTIGDPGLTALAGFTPQEADINTVQFLRPNVGWKWIMSQADYGVPITFVKDPTKVYSSDNGFQLRWHHNKGNVLPDPLDAKWTPVTNLPDGYAFGLTTNISYFLTNSSGTRTYSQIAALVPDSIWELTSNYPTRYCLDPSVDYRLREPVNADEEKRFNYKSNTPFLMPDSNSKQDVSKVMLAFDTTQDLYISKYSIKNDVFPLHTADIVTGNVEIVDNNISWYNGGANGWRISNVGVGFTDWSYDNMPLRKTQHDSPDLSLRLPSYQKFDHLHNYINYNSSINEDPLKINGGIRIGKIQSDGIAKFTLKVTRSKGSVTNCKIYLKKSSFNDTVPAANDCFTGSWDGGSGALCGISPKSDGTISVSFPAVKDDEVWIMVSPESRPTGVIAVDDSTYAYAQLVQCDGTLTKDN